MENPEKTYSKLYNNYKKHHIENYNIKSREEMRMTLRKNILKKNIELAHNKIKIEKNFVEIQLKEYEIKFEELNIDLNNNEIQKFLNKEFLKDEDIFYSIIDFIILHKNNIEYILFIFLIIRENYNFFFDNNFNDIFCEKLIYTIKDNLISNINFIYSKPRNLNIYIYNCLRFLLDIINKRSIKELSKEDFLNLIFFIFENMSMNSVIIYHNLILLIFIFDVYPIETFNYFEKEYEKLNKLCLNMGKLLENFQNKGIPLKDYDYLFLNYFQLFEKIINVINLKDKQTKIFCVKNFSWKFLLIMMMNFCPFTFQILAKIANIFYICYLEEELFIIINNPKLNLFKIIESFIKNKIESLEMKFNYKSTETMIYLKFCIAIIDYSFIRDFYFSLKEFYIDIINLLLKNIDILYQCKYTTEYFIALLNKVLKEDLDILFNNNNLNSIINLIIYYDGKYLDSLDFLNRLCKNKNKEDIYVEYIKKYSLFEKLFKILNDLIENKNYIEIFYLLKFLYFQFNFFLIERGGNYGLFSEELLLNFYNKVSFLKEQINESLLKTISDFNIEESEFKNLIQIFVDLKYKTIIFN